jgi:cell division protease FtsH
MATDAWLPVQYELPNGSWVSSVLDSGPDWQILALDRGRRALIVPAPLLDRWVSAGLAEEGCARNFEFGARSLAAVISDPSHTLAHLANCRSPSTKAEAMAFGSALRETRAIDRHSSLHDALYLEKLSRLLPTYSSDTKVEDDLVLGSWLTGGLSMSVFPLRRIQKVLSWLSPENLKRVVESAGYEVNELVSSGEGGPGTVRVKHDLRVERPEGEESSADKRFQLPGRQARSVLQRTRCGCYPESGELQEPRN